MPRKRIKKEEQFLLYWYMEGVHCFDKENPDQFSNTSMCFKQQLFTFASSQFNAHLNLTSVSC